MQREISKVNDVLVFQTELAHSKLQRVKSIRQRKQRPELQSLI